MTEVMFMAAGLTPIDCAKDVMSSLCAAALSVPTVYPPRFTAAVTAYAYVLDGGGGRSIAIGAVDSVATAERL